MAKPLTERTQNNKKALVKNVSNLNNTPKGEIVFGKHFFLGT